MIVGIFPNLSKNGIEKHVNELCCHLEKHNIEFYIVDSYRQEAEEKGIDFSLGKWRALSELLEQMDVAFSLGGDGSLISVAKKLFGSGIPVCGVNLGELGFLNVVEPNELDRRLQDIKQKNFKICERAVLTSYILDENDNRQDLPLAVNEVVIGRSKPGRMARLRLYINGVFTEEYPADGIIVSTATGSTGYALSCGGPILHPNLNNILVNPICPHLLQSAPLLLNSDDEVMITMPEREKRLFASVDGNESFSFDNKKRLIIRKDNEVIPFLYFPDQNFFRLLFPKLTKAIYHVSK